jgi:hypothetical protein
MEDVVFANCDGWERVVLLDCKTLTTFGTVDFKHVLVLRHLKFKLFSKRISN